MMSMHISERQLIAVKETSFCFELLFFFLKQVWANTVHSPCVGLNAEPVVAIFLYR